MRRHSAARLRQNKEESPGKKKTDQAEKEEKPEEKKKTEEAAPVEEAKPASIAAQMVFKTCTSVDAIRSLIKSKK